MPSDICCYCECFAVDRTCPGDGRCYDPLRKEYYSFKREKPMINNGVSCLFSGEKVERRDDEKL